MTTSNALSGCSATHEVAAISDDLCGLSVRIRNLQHDDDCRCPFCLAVPHVWKTLDAVAEVAQTFSALLDEQRPKSAEEKKRYEERCREEQERWLAKGYVVVCGEGV